MNYLKCNKCGWVHFGLTEQQVTEEVNKFNDFFDSLTQEYKNHYGNRKSSIERYQKCFKCGNNYKDFSEAAPKDCPYGSTIQPIMINIDK